MKNMHFEIIEIGSKDVSGLPILLTSSQSENFKIISNHWISFNKKLKTINRSYDESWIKYGLTFKRNSSYYYMPAVPLNTDINFEIKTINHGKYAMFQHIGDMKDLKKTYYNIYRIFIPESKLIINKQREILHFEQYDNRFKWNRSDSIISICIPLDQ